MRDIQTSRKTIEVPIPPAIDRNGGSFEVDLGASIHPVLEASSNPESDVVSVEDSYGCKRDISVPGVVVNVRRVKVRGWRIICNHILTHNIAAYGQVLRRG